MAIDLKIIGEEVDRKVVLRLEGRIDVSSTPLLEKKIDGFLKEGHFFILLDFGGIDYLSSAGLRLLLSMTKKLKEKKGGLLIFSVQEEVQEVFKISGFDKILHLFPGEKQALQYTHSHP